MLFQKREYLIDQISDRAAFCASEQTCFFQSGNQISDFFFSKRMLWAFEFLSALLHFSTLISRASEFQKEEEEPR